MEKEIETVLRKSHSEQFDWLENRFDVKLRKDLPAWSTFIEVTERRNLFVHTNGVVSSQYLRVCSENGVQIPDDVKIGIELDVTRQYFSKAYRCVFEIGVKLAHVLWRKLVPNDLSAADRQLNAVTYELLVDDRNRLAITLLDFAAVVLKKYSDEQHRRIFVVNRAQAYKWATEEKTAREIMTSEDWTAASNEFKIAEAVLLDDFARAAEIMKDIGGHGYPRKMDYRDWPLFKEFRKSGDFLNAFEEIFGEPFSQTTTEEKEQQELPAAADPHESETPDAIH